MNKLTIIIAAVLFLSGGYSRLTCFQYSARHWRTGDGL